MKKIIVLALVLLILIFLIVESKSDLYINWEIYLPGIQKRKIIFDDFFQDGDQISIFTYYSQRSIKKTIRENKFKKIFPENITDIQEDLSDFYNGLGTNIKNINGKEIYDKNINIEQLLKSDNYYLIKRKEESYIILILDIESKCLYTFITIRH